MADTSIGNAADSETLVAMRGSVAKWEGIVNDGQNDGGADDCPLCDLFICGSCNGCPVADESGSKNCYSTPHEAWCTHHNDVHDLDHAVVHEGCAECERLAKMELAFLAGLLEKMEGAS